VVFTVPRTIRPILMRRRSLLGVVSPIGYETTLRLLERELSGVDGRPSFTAHEATAYVYQGRRIG